MSEEDSNAPTGIEPNLRFLRVEEVYQLVGIGRSFLDDLVREGDFPAPVYLSAKTRVWIEAEVLAWMRDKAATSRKRPPATHKVQRRRELV
ncbi:helix-turn-helix transcriptional regulator [Xanthobacter autotrophicus]|uniref:helix-turn-helix transcriptional regulator n=1 Tax=Xanthobacter autotrophicus TaxID=280 RepID=UPI0037295509